MQTGIWLRSLLGQMAIRELTRRAGVLEGPTQASSASASVRGFRRSQRKRLAEASAIGAWREAGDPAKRRTESARVIASNGKANVGHRGGALR